MAGDQLARVMHSLRGVLSAPGADAAADARLLEHFLLRGDESAFEALVRRHGPMVLGVCRRILGQEADAEDAFQATFLVLVRKADSVRPREMVGNWLYGVACRTALGARKAAARRRARERQAAGAPRPAPADDPGGDLRSALDREVARLPDSYRAALVLCDLEGKTRPEAARQLGWPEGTVASRLARARALLARRLARHGLAPAGGSLAAALGQGAASAFVPQPLVGATVKAAGVWAAGQAAGAVPAKAAALAEGVLKAMFVSKVRFAGVVLLALSVAGAGAGVVAYQALGAERGKAARGAPPRAPAEVEDRRVQQAKAEVQAAEANLRAAQAQLDQARAKLQLAQATYEAARAKAGKDGGARVGSVSADEIWQAFRANDALADEKFMGKEVRITGPVQHIKRLIEEEGRKSTLVYRLTMDAIGPGGAESPEPGLPLVFVFPAKERKQLAALTAGQQVTVQGTCQGVEGKSVLFTDCSVVKVGADE
jgi:RNA polymerase sigma factor (sigma-70 family)